MKATTRLAMGAAVVLLVAAGLQPAEAICPITSPYLIQFAGAQLIANPNWCGNPYGCYEAEGGPPVSANLDGFFWAQGGSNETLGVGIDNGTWLPLSPDLRGWVKQRSVQFDDLYHYPAWISKDDPAIGGYVSGTELGWAGDGRIDGCPDDLGLPLDQRCTCVLFTDAWGGDGYFALMSKQSNSQGNFIFQATANGVYTMGPIPQAGITGSSSDGGIVTFDISVPAPTAGIYADPGCDCSFGFRIFAAVMPEGGMPPSTRDACTERALFRATGQSLSYDDPGFVDACRAAGFVWVPADGLTGTPQNATEFSGTSAAAQISVDCGEPTLGYDLYLATAIGNAEGAGAHLQSVGQSSFQVKCGAYTLAEPERPERPSQPGRSGDTPRGRDSNRRER